MIEPTALVTDAAAPPKLAPHDKLRILTAAHHAATRYPGPVGELVAREVRAYAEFGYQFDQPGRGLMPRVVDELMRPAAA